MMLPISVAVIIIYGVSLQITLRCEIMIRSLYPDVGGHLVTPPVVLRHFSINYRRTEIAQ